MSYFILKPQAFSEGNERLKFQNSRILWRCIDSTRHRQQEKQVLQELCAGLNRFNSLKKAQFRQG
jgi:hypothetical protein